MSDVNEIAARYASQPPRAVRLTKRLMKMAQRTELRDFLQTCAYFRACATTAEHLEAVRSFLEKR